MYCTIRSVIAVWVPFVTNIPLSELPSAIPHILDAFPLLSAKANLLLAQVWRIPDRGPPIRPISRSAQDAVIFVWGKGKKRNRKNYYFSKTSPDENFPFHWQTDFTHVICCVIPCVSPFTPYGLAPYTRISDGTMDLALSIFFLFFEKGSIFLVPKVSRFTNMQIMRKVHQVHILL